MPDLRPKPMIQNLTDRITEISGRTHTPKPGSLEWFLAGASRLYATGVGLRSMLYDTGVIRQKHLPCPVISVGNIVAGGSGKTPMAACLAGVLKHLGHRPVVISRGYRGTLSETAAVVGDGTHVFLDPGTAGDEPHMMAAARRFPVVVGRKRYEAGRLALERLDVDAVILDDGFQHRGLARDLDLVLFDYTRPLGNGRMIPAGRLRESLEMCRRRADGVVFTRCPESGNGLTIPGAVSESLGDLPVFYTRHTPVLMPVAGRPGQVPPASFRSLEGRKALLFSGIAHNPRFRETIDTLGATVVRHLEFPDHYRYKKSDFKQIQRQADRAGAEWILTTEKDWVKVDGVFEWHTDLAAVGIQMTVDDMGAFSRFIASRLNSAAADIKIR